MNFFCHQRPRADAAREAKWVERLAPYRESSAWSSRQCLGRGPFGDEMCALVEEFQPRVVSFHFGLPEKRLLRSREGGGCDA